MNLESSSTAGRKQTPIFKEKGGDWQAGDLGLLTPWGRHHPQGRIFQIILMVRREQWLTTWNTRKEEKIELRSRSQSLVLEILWRIPLVSTTLLGFSVSRTRSRIRCRLFRPSRQGTESSAARTQEGTTWVSYRILLYFRADIPSFLRWRTQGHPSSTIWLTPTSWRPLRRVWDHSVRHSRRSGI